MAGHHSIGMKGLSVKVFSHYKCTLISMNSLLSHPDYKFKPYNKVSPKSNCNSSLTATL